LVARAFDAAGIARPPDALARFLKIYGAHLLDHTRPYPGIAAALDALGARASLAVLTNKPIASTREILAGLDLARHFDADAVVGGDGPFPRKPDPAALRHLIGRAGATAASTLLVGDSIIDWKTARAAPARLCLARYGFGFEAFPLNDLASDDLVVDSPTDLVAL